MVRPSLRLGIRFCVVAQNVCLYCSLEDSYQEQDSCNGMSFCTLCLSLFTALVIILNESSLPVSSFFVYQSACKTSCGDNSCNLSINTDWTVVTWNCRIHCTSHLEEEIQGVSKPVCGGQEAGALGCWGLWINHIYLREHKCELPLFSVTFREKMLMIGWLPMLGQLDCSEFN